MQCISPLAVTMLGYEHSFHVSFLKDVFIYLKGKERVPQLESWFHLGFQPPANVHPGRQPVMAQMIGFLLALGCQLLVLALAIVRTWGVYQRMGALSLFLPLSEIKKQISEAVEMSVYAQRKINYPEHSVSDKREHIIVNTIIF